MVRYDVGFDFVSDPFELGSYVSETETNDYSSDENNSKAGNN